MKRKVNDSYQQELRTTRSKWNQHSNQKLSNLISFPLQKSRNKRNSIKKTYEKDTSNIQNHWWPHPSSLWPKRMENYDHARIITILMNIPSRTLIQYPMSKVFWTNYKDQNTSLQWTYDLDTTTFVFKSKTDGKEHSGRIKDYLNQLLCSLECATAQQHSRRWWTQYSCHLSPKTSYWFRWMTFSSMLQQRNNYTKRRKKYSKYFWSTTYISNPRNANSSNNDFLISDTLSLAIKSKWT